MRRVISTTSSRRLTAIAAVVVACAIIPIASASSRAHHADLTTVSFLDDFTTNGTDSGYIVAGKPGGFLEKQGLQQNYSPGTGSPATAQAVATGQVQFGEISTSALVTGVAAGEPIKAIAVVTGQDGFGVLTTADITTPAGLVGKTITTGNSLLVPIFQAWMKAKGIDPSKVNLVTVAPAALDTSVTSGAANGCLCLSYGDRLRINAAGTKTSFFPFSEVGLGFTGNVIITNNNMIQNSPDIVRKFLKATLQGWNYAFDNPNLAAGILQAQVASQSPLANAQTNVLTLKAMRKVRFTPNQKGHPVGWMSVIDWATAIKQLKLQNVLTIAPPSADSLFTNAFIPNLGRYAK
jgi:NitT/TauT family transport system substrate-binding protein